MTCWRTASLLSPAPLRGLLSLRFPPTQKEIFRDELAIYRREGLLADPAMDQSMREVGVSFHAHRLWPLRKKDANALMQASPSCHRRE